MHKRFSPIQQRDSLFILPTRRGIELFADELDHAGASIPAKRITTGELISYLVDLELRPASDFEQTLAWAAALASQPRDQLQSLVPVIPDADGLASWVELGGTLRRLHRSLAAEAIDFPTAARAASTVAEQTRWGLLLQLRQDYLHHLHAAQRVDRDEAALRQLQQDKLFAAPHEIVLVGTTDLSPLVQRLLKRCSTRVISLIASDGSVKDQFDAFGVVRPATWADHQLPLELSQLIPATDMPDQSRAVADFVLVARRDHEPDQITIGVTDESQVQPIVGECLWSGVHSHQYLGHKLQVTAIGRLLELLVSYVRHRTWRALASLVRHADVSQFVSRRLAKPTQDRSAWLAQLDEMIASTFPRSVDVEPPPKAPHREAMIQLLATIDEWTSPLMQSRRSIGTWSAILLDVLSQLDVSTQSVSVASPDNRHTDHQDRTRIAFGAVSRMLTHFQHVAEGLDFPVEGHVAVEMLMARMAEERIIGPQRDKDVSICGWLDLALDPSPVLVVCGLNHPFVPEAVSGDPFLPASLRTNLLQQLNDRRYARDVAALHQMLACRIGEDRRIAFVVGAQTADGSPSPPSRLLAAATPVGSARRVHHCLTKRRAARAETSLNNLDSSRDFERQSIATIKPLRPTPILHRPVTRMSVTGFKDYLTCPYRFYLRHVLGLRPMDDAAMELAANQFGDLVHGALEWFGESDEKDETDVEAITEALMTQLDRYAEAFYGDNVSATVALQIRQAQRRLKTVAIRQAERIADGWHIARVEASVDEKSVDDRGQPKKPTGITVDGQFMGLRGRFDRIDHHPATNRWAILDYKTHRFPPEKKHLKKQVDGSTCWIDLQLPLYRRFIPDLGIPVDPSHVELGYFNVAEKDSDTKINIASFQEADFEKADEIIEECVRGVQSGIFTPSQDPVEFDDYQWLMNQRQLPLPSKSLRTTAS
ncbi:MAG: PD-(D/E)XK nuclease family protein [Planctomycetota bacterium]